MNDELSDHAALTKAQRGDPDGLAVLYDRYSTFLYRAAVLLLHNRRDAEDLIHDIFLEAWQKAEQYDPRRGSIKAWLMLRVRSRAIDRIRSAKIASQYALKAGIPPDIVLASTDQGEIAADGSRAFRAVQELREHQRKVVELGYFEGLTCREISQRCNIPIGTVESRLSAGMLVLREQLAPRAEVSDD